LFFLLHMGMQQLKPMFISLPGRQQQPVIPSSYRQTPTVDHPPN
jgi:hypothetical protein